MLPHELNDTCKEAFLELVFQTSKFHNKKYAYFHPFKGKNYSYHITLAELSTGYSSVVPFTAKTAMLLEKENVKEIFNKIMTGILVAIDKHKEFAKPVDYTQYPITAGGHRCKLEKIETNGKVTVEIYGWSKLLLK